VRRVDASFVLADVMNVVSSGRFTERLCVRVDMCVHKLTIDGETGIAALRRARADPRPTRVWVGRVIDVEVERQTD
jgi:hypothetical protein